MCILLNLYAIVFIGDFYFCWQIEEVLFVLFSGNLCDADIPFWLLSPLLLSLCVAQWVLVVYNSMGRKMPCIMMDPIILLYWLNVRLKTFDTLKKILLRLFPLIFSHFFQWVGKLKISHVAHTWGKFSFLVQQAESNSFRNALSQFNLPTYPKNK